MNTEREVTVSVVFFVYTLEEYIQLLWLIRRNRLVIISWRMLAGTVL
jgi:hypothetical protein